MHKVLRYNERKCNAMKEAYEEIRPLIETLEADSEPRSKIKCSIEGCGQIFSSSSQMTFHKAKVHGVDVSALMPKKVNLACHYHCPVVGCYFNGERYFSNYKLLKKHYSGVHSDKKYTCSKCQKCFGLDSARKRHEASCGVIYNCKTCDCPYTTREALVMHCKRRQHQFPDSMKEGMLKSSADKNKHRVGSNVSSAVKSTEESKTKLQPCVVFVQNVEPQVTSTPKPLRQILPKPVIASVIPMTKVTVESNQISVEKFDFPSKQSAEIQTDIFGIRNPLEQKKNILFARNLIEPISINRATTATQVSLGKSQVLLPANSSVMSTTGMQTSLSTLPKRKRHCSIAETQTSGDMILKSAMASANLPLSNESISVQKSPRSRLKISRRRSMKTSEVQTRETFPPRKRRKRRHSGRQAVTTDSAVNFDGARTSINTDRLFMDYVSSISTQTQRSYLEEFGHCGLVAQPVQNSETQTSLSALFKNMRESLLSEENPTLLSDLGITFSDQGQALLATVNSNSNVISSEASVQAESNILSRHESSPTTNTFYASEEAFLPMIEGPCHDQGPSRPSTGPSEQIPAKETDVSESMDTNITDLTELSNRNDVASVNPDGTMAPAFKEAGAGIDLDNDLEHFRPAGIDFGIQTGTSYSSKESESDQYLHMQGWNPNPCLTSAIAKDSHTQTMTPRSVDCGAQTSVPQSRTLTLFERPEHSIMLTTNIGTDMHTQTADDLLDFLMTNMETQTEDLIVSGFGLSDIETQTPSEHVSIDTLVTTETQTNMQSLVHEENDLTLFMDMETQTPFNTDNLDPGDFTDSHTQTNFELFNL